MLRKLWGMLRGRSPRDVFTFWDGSRWRGADPIVVCRRLLSHDTFDAESHPKLIELEDDDAVRITALGVRDAFGLPEYDGRRGLTEAECVSLLGEFWDWCGDLKKKRNPLPNSPEPTDLESFSAAIGTTAHSSDSGSTSVASRDARAGV